MITENTKAIEDECDGIPRMEICFDKKFKTVYKTIFLKWNKGKSALERIVGKKRKKMRKRGQVVGKLHYFSSLSLGFSALSIRTDSGEDRLI